VTRTGRGSSRAPRRRIVLRVDSVRTERLAPLTGVRFAAALGILLFHYGGPLVAWAPAWVERVRTGGFVWVGLFYLLSGFVLGRAHPRPMDADQRREFYVARLARLYPAYLLAFLLSTPFALDRWADGGPLAGAKAFLVAAAALLLVQAWIPPIARLWNAPGWSTSAVAAFYVAFPFAAARLSRLSRRGLAGAAVGAWALSLAFPAVYLALAPDGTVTNFTWQEPAWLEALKFHPLARVGEFLAGVALGLLDRRGVAVGRGGAVAALAAAASAVALLAFADVPYALLHNGALLPLFAAIVLGLAHAGGLLGRALASRPARALGDASFALYALQEPLWNWARRLAPNPDAAPSGAFAAAFVVAAVAVSVAVSSGLERPARRALRAALGGVRTVRAPHPAALPPAPRQQG
jgi:peptidoglycan/LPS O-acetylase OafA/YrhL